MNSEIQTQWQVHRPVCKLCKRVSDKNIWDLTTKQLQAFLCKKGWVFFTRDVKRGLMDE